jgi:hypothetical protein
LVQSALERCEEAQGGEPDVLVRTGTRAELSRRYGSKTLATNSNLRNPFHDTFRAPENIFDQPNDTWAKKGRVCSAELPRNCDPLTIVNNEHAVSPQPCQLQAWFKVNHRAVNNYTAGNQISGRTGTRAELLHHFWLKPSLPTKMWEIVSRDVYQIELMTLVPWKSFLSSQTESPIPHIEEARYHQDRGTEAPNKHMTDAGSHEVAPCAQ